MNYAKYLGMDLEKDSDLLYLAREGYFYINFS